MPIDRFDWRTFDARPIPRSPRSAYGLVGFGWVASNTPSIQNVRSVALDTIVYVCHLV